MNKATKLLKLAKGKFKETLTESEIKLLGSVVNGELADYSIDEDCKLRALVIEWLCSDKEGIELVTHRGICIKKADINGPVNLAYLSIPFPLYFEKCNIQNEIELHGTRLQELYLGGCHTGSVSAYGVKIDGYIFLRDDFMANGKVDFTGAMIEGDFDCSNGHFFHSSGIAINLSKAKIKNNVSFTDDFESKGMVVMVDSHIGGSLLCNGGEFIKSDKGTMAVNASRLICRGDIFLKKGFKAEGEVTFSGGTIGGNIECFEGIFCNHSGDALNIEAANVGGSTFLMGDFKGEVRLVGATVRQSFQCDGGKFDNPNGYAINADSANIDRNVFLRNAFKANGEVNLIGAKIGGDIDCEKSHFINPDGVAIHADEIEVGGSIFLRHGFIAEGVVSFAGGRVKINLDCEYGCFTNRSRRAIVAEGINIGGSVLLCSRYMSDQTKNNMPPQFKAEGSVNFRRAVIGGAFDCHGSLFINHGDNAITCTGIKVKDNVYLCDSSKVVKQEKKRNAFRAEGQVDFSNARIGGSLYCNGGEFINKGKGDKSTDQDESVALNLDCVKVDDSIMLSNNFHAEGEVRLLGAEIGQQVNCISGSFINPDGVAFAAECARIGGSLLLCGKNFKGNTTKETSPDDNLIIVGKVLLNGIEVKKCFLWCKVDSPEKITLDLQHATIGSLWDEKESWPQKDKLLLHGLVYNEISDRAPRDSSNRKKWLCKQPIYMSQPYEQLARVLKEGGHENDAKKILIAKENEKSKRLKCYKRLPSVLYGLLVGYGYRPFRAFWIGIILVIIGGFLFSVGFQESLMAPVKISDNNPEFHAFLYSLDVFLPVIDLHQANYWLPDSTKDFKLDTSEKISKNLSSQTLWYYLWFEIAAGWVLTTLFVVGLTGLVRK